MSFKDAEFLNRRALNKPASSRNDKIRSQKTIVAIMMRNEELDQFVYKLENEEEYKNAGIEIGIEIKNEIP